MKKVPLALISFFAPGLGPILLGHYALGFCYLTLFLSLRIVVQKMALTRPDVFFYGSVALGLYALIGVVLTLFLKEKKFLKAKTCGIVILLALLSIYGFHRAVDRVQVWNLPTDRMLPNIFPQDIIAADSRHQGFKQGDLVVIQVPETNHYIIRRIERLDGATVFTTSDNPKKIDHGCFLLVDVRGKVLYVFYSSLKERLFKWIY